MYDIDILERQHDIINIQNDIIDALYIIASQHAAVAQGELDAINDKIYQAAQLRKDIREV